MRKTVRQEREDIAKIVAYLNEFQGASINEISTGTGLSYTYVRRIIRVVHPNLIFKIKNRKYQKGIINRY